MDGLKNFCRVSTAHGVRYFVCERTSRLEKLVWACLLITAIYETVNYMQYYWDDNNNSPFVTSFSSIPIRDVPFPALSVRSTQAHTLPPWLNMVSKILDNVEFDCLVEDEGCMNQTESVRQHFGNLVDYAVKRNFEALEKVYTTVKLTRKEISQMCVLLMRLLGKPAYGTIYTMVRLLEQSQEKIDLKHLVAEIFRIPKSLALTKIEDFFQEYGRNLTQTSISRATSALFNSSMQSTIFAFVASQGNLSPKVSLGTFIYIESMLKYKSPGGFDPKAIEVKNVLENLLSNKTSFTDIMQIALGGYKSNAIKEFMKCDPLLKNGLSQCILHKNNTEFKCCNLFNNTLSHYETFLRVMKYSMRPVTFDIQDKSYVTDLEEAMAVLPYQRQDTKVFMQGREPKIFQSRYFGKRENSDSSTACHFSNIYSKGGISSTFNSPFFWNIYKENYFTRAFFKQLYEKESFCQQSLAAGPLHASSHGQQYAFEAIIPATETGGEVIELHSPFDIPDLNARPIYISQGKTYTITVTPSKTEVGKKLGKEDFAKLGCFAGEDHNLTLFKDYGQSQCLFECQMRLAVRQCGCIPWNYPHIDHEVPVCLEHQHRIFKEAFLLAEEDHDACDCPPACNRIHYTYHIDTAQTDYYRMCKKEGHWERMGLHKRRWIRNNALRLQDIKNVKDFLEEEFPPDPCQTLMPNMAFIQVYMAPPDVSVALTSLRATLPEHVATFGNTLPNLKKTFHNTILL